MKYEVKGEGGTYFQPGQGRQNVARRGGGRRGDDFVSNLRISDTAGADGGEKRTAHRAQENAIHT